MWSTSQPQTNSLSSIRQYSQRPPARMRTSRRNCCPMTSPMPCRQSLRFRKNDQMFEFEEIIQFQLFLGEQT